MALSEALSLLLVVYDLLWGLLDVHPLVLFYLLFLNLHGELLGWDGDKHHEIASMDMIVLHVMTFPDHYIVVS